MSGVYRIDLTCPSCGAAMSVEEGQEELFCPYCGKKMLIVREGDKLTAKEAEDIAYGTERGKLRARDELVRSRERRKRIGRWKRRLITLLCIAAFLAFCVIFRDLRRPLVSAFDYVELHFSGVSGEGKAEYTLGSFPEEVDEHRIHFELSPDSGLKNGDSVTLRAESEDYRLKEKLRKYKVSGLESCLSELSSLDEETLSAIHREALEEIRKGYFPMTMNGRKQDEELGWKPLSLFLSSEGEEKNALYDLIEIDYRTRDGGQFSFYGLARFQNLLVRPGGSIRYQKLFALGDFVSLGSTNDDSLIGFSDPDAAKAALKSEQNAGAELTERDLS